MRPTKPPQIRKRARRAARARALRSPLGPKLPASAIIGLSINGKSWGRPDDTIDIAGVVNGISGAHVAFLNAGGVGILIGDGQLQNHRTEKIVEVYNSYALTPSTRLTFDYQFLGQSRLRCRSRPCEHLGRPRTLAVLARGGSCSHPDGRQCSHFRFWHRRSSASSVTGIGQRAIFLGRGTSTRSRGRGSTTTPWPTLASDTQSFHRAHDRDLVQTSPPRGVLMPVNASAIARRCHAVWRVQSISANKQ